MGNWKNKIFKAFSITFMVFIVILIVVSFGMPDLGVSNVSGEFYVARVGDEVITVADVSRTREQMKAQYQSAGNDLLMSRAGEQNIYQKLFLHLLKQYGMHPSEKTRKKIIADYIRLQFPQYYGPDGIFNIKKFQDEILFARKLTFSELENSIVSEYAFNQNYRTFLEFSRIGSGREAQAEKILKDTAYSITFGEMDAEAIKNYLLNSQIISEKEIQDEWKASSGTPDKDKKNISNTGRITNDEKKVIIEKIFQKNKDAYIKKVMDAISGEKSRNIAIMGMAYKMKITRVKEYRLDGQGNPPEFSGMETQEEFQKNLVNLEPGSLSTPFYFGGKILVFSPEKKELKNADAPASPGSNNYQFMGFDMMMEGFRKSTDIIRYQG